MPGQQPQAGSTALGELNRVSDALASAESIGAAYEVTVQGLCALSGADASYLFRADRADRLARLVDVTPAEAPSVRLEGIQLLHELLRGANSDSRQDRQRTGARLWPERPAADVVVAPVGAGDTELGYACCVTHDGPEFSPEAVGLLRAACNQAAMSIARLELIERLTTHDRTADFFAALGSGGGAGASPPRGCDLARPHVFLVAHSAAPGTEWPAIGARLEQALRTAGAWPFLSVERQRLRAVVVLGQGRSADRVRSVCDEVGRAAGVSIGVSGVRLTASASRDGLREATDSARIGLTVIQGGGAATLDELGAYRYLRDLDLERAGEDAYVQAVEKLIEHDEERLDSLLLTLEHYLAHRHRVSAVAEQLGIHPNTLRQRLRRIEKVSGLSLETDDLLALELAIRVSTLRRQRHGGARPRLVAVAGGADLPDARDVG